MSETVGVLLSSQEAAPSALALKTAYQSVAQIEGQVPGPGGPSGSTKKRILTPLPPPEFCQKITLDPGTTDNAVSSEIWEALHCRLAAKLSEL